MGFNPIFYAGRLKLSEVTIDSDLNMGGRNISGVDTIRAGGSEVTIDSDLNMGGHNILRAGRVDSPYTTETWPTETLDWGDIPAGDVEYFDFVALQLGPPWTTLKTFVTPPGDNYYTWRFTINTYASTGATANFRITANGVEVYSVEEHGTGILTVNIAIPAGSTVAVQGCNNTEIWYEVRASSSVQNLGIVGGPKTFDLSGKWLALGLDMKGIEATVKIQGVEMPYSDYAKYFPLAPTELTFPGGWDASQNRPIVKVYK